MDIRESMIKALRKRYEAVIEEAKATAEVYLHRPVGIGEHPQFIEELDKLINTCLLYTSPSPRDS